MSGVSDLRSERITKPESQNCTYFGAYHDVALSQALHRNLTKQIGMTFILGYELFLNFVLTNSYQRKGGVSMGAWAELDAIYPPGKLTPATAFIVALTYMVGADDVYLEEEEGSLAAFLPKHGLGDVRYDDLLDRAEAYLQAASLDQFLAEAPLVLNKQQKVCILLNMFDSALADGMVAPEETDVFKQFLKAFDISLSQIQPYIEGLMMKHNLKVFTQ